MKEIELKHLEAIKSTNKKLAKTLILLQELLSLKILSSNHIDKKKTLISIRAKEAELAELKRDQENLKAAHTNTLDTSFQLKQDLDSVKTDIDAISTQNAEVNNKTLPFN